MEADRCAPHRERQVVGVPDVSVDAAEDVRVRRHRIPLDRSDTDVPRRPKELGEDPTLVSVRSERYMPDACREHHCILGPKPTR